MSDRREVARLISASRLPASYWVVALIALLGNLATALLVDSPLWRATAPLVTVFAFGWWWVWLGFEALRATTLVGLDDLRDRVNATLNVFDLEQNPVFQQNRYLSQKVDHIRRAAAAMSSRNAITFQSDQASQEMISFARTAKYSIQGISYAGERVKWGTQYGAWLEEAKQLAALDSTIVERIFAFGQHQISNETELKGIVGAMSDNFYTNGRGGERSGIRCFWFPVEFFSHLDDARRIDITIIDNYIAGTGASREDTLVLRNTDEDPMGSLEVTWDRAVIDDAIRVWNVISKYSQEIDLEETTPGVYFKETMPDIYDVLAQEGIRAAYNRMMSARAT